MPTHTLETIKDMQPGTFGEEHRAMLEDLAGGMLAETEALLAAAGRPEIDALVERFNGAYKAIKKLNESQGVTPKDLYGHFAALQKMYSALKTAVRKERAIHSEDPRYVQTRNIANFCATLNARILAALEKGLNASAKASDTADDLGIEFGNGVKVEVNAKASTAVQPKEPTA